MPVDPRIIGVGELDRHKSVLTDAHSLSRLIELTGSFPRNVSSDEFTRTGNLDLAYILQNLVLYDVMVVDSVLLDTYPDVAEAITRFSGVIFGVHLKWDIRSEIGKIVERAASWDPIDSSRPPDGFEPQHWRVWWAHEASEKPLMDQMAEHVPALLPASYADDPLVIAHVNGRFRPDFPLCCVTSGMTLARAHYYLELSRYLKIPLAADPIRSPYFENLISRLKKRRHQDVPEHYQGVPEQIVENFDRSVGSAGGLVSVNFSLPPVVEYVAKYASVKGCTLYESAMEIRNSENAVRFREWCSRLRGLLSERAGTAERQEVERELRAVCDAWKQDVGERVNYRTRKVSLDWIPVVGRILKAGNFHEIEVKDPVLAVDETTSYLLFLNDLYRQPHLSGK